MSASSGRGTGPKGAAAFQEVEKRLEQLFGAFGATLGEALEAAKNGEASGRERVLEQTLDTSKGPVKMRAGLSVRFGGLDGTGATSTERDPARPVKPGRAPTPPDDTRSPLIDIYDSADHWGLNAELPGVAEAEVSVKIEGRRLIVTTTGARRFRAEADLPDGLDATLLKRQLVNGILDLRIPRAAR